MSLILEIVSYLVTVPGSSNLFAAVVVAEFVASNVNSADTTCAVDVAKLSVNSA
jgi:hypothetical protein